MKTKSVCRGFISLFVNFITIGQCGQQSYMKKFAGGGEKEKEPYF